MIMWSTWRCGRHDDVVDMMMWSTWWCGWHDDVVEMMMWFTWWCGWHDDVVDMMMWLAWWCGWHDDVLDMMMWLTWWCGWHDDVPKSAMPDCQQWPFRSNFLWIRTLCRFSNCWRRLWFRLRLRSILSVPPIGGGRRRRKRRQRCHALRHAVWQGKGMEGVTRGWPKLIQKSVDSSHKCHWDNEVLILIWYYCILTLWHYDTDIKVRILTLGYYIWLWLIFQIWHHEAQWIWCGWHDGETASHDNRP